MSKRRPTELTWEEENPSSYLFDKESLVRLRQARERLKVKMASEERMRQARHIMAEDISIEEALRVLIEDAGIDEVRLMLDMIVGEADEKLELRPSKG